MKVSGSAVDDIARTALERERARGPENLRRQNGDVFNMKPNKQLHKQYHVMKSFL